MTGLRRDMEAARRDARRPRDLREALERAAGGEAWLQRALEGPATCPQAVNAMARLGEVFHNQPWRHRGAFPSPSLMPHDVSVPHGGGHGCCTMYQKLHYQRPSGYVQRNPM